MIKKGMIVFLSVLFLFAINSEGTEPNYKSRANQIKLSRGGQKYIVSPGKLISGGPPQDGIPSIDRPKFVSVNDADEWIKDNELVLALTYKGTSRVYPLQILVWHEIVNDTVAGDPILITYCPLCGSGIAYERKVDGVEVEFGTTGKLYNSNLVMYDRRSDTYWTQIEGLAIIGKHTGSKLTPVSIDTVSWKEWKDEHPDSEVLSKKTGHYRAYGKDPYGEYYTDSFIFFPVEHRRDRIHPKTVIFGIEVDGEYKAYRADDLERKRSIIDIVNGKTLKLEKSGDGVVTIEDQNSKKIIIKERDFWFAWYAFHPETTLYDDMRK